MSAAAQGDTKSRLLEAATELFSRDGFEGASTRAIGSLAGVNIATLAYHFGSKEGLYEAVLAQIYEEILALEPPRKLAPTPPGRIREAVAIILGFARQRQFLVRLVLILLHGSLPTALRDPLNARLLSRTAEWMGALDLPFLRAHSLKLLSLNHLIARYAVSPTADVLSFLPPGTEESEVEEAMAQHLGDLAVALLLGSSWDPKTSENDG